MVIDGCLYPLDLDNAIPLELVQDHPETNENIFSDAPDPGSQANLEEESCSPEPEPPYNDLGPDIDELLNIVKLEDLDLQLRFIKEIKNASLEDDGMRMDEEDLERLRNPLNHELTLDDTSDLCLTLELFIANINSPVKVYNSNCVAILRRHPNDNIFTHNSVKCFMRHLTGVVPLIHDMCINTCIALMSLLTRYAHIPFYFRFSFTFPTSPIHPYAPPLRRDRACARTTIALALLDRSRLFDGHMTYDSHVFTSILSVSNVPPPAV